MTIKTVYALGPEIVLVAAAMGVYLLGAFFRERSGWSWLGLGGIVAAAAVLGADNVGGHVGPVVLDPLAHFTRWLALASGGLLTLMTFRASIHRGTPEYVGSLLLTVAGLMLVSVAEDLLVLFLALELISIPTYALLYLGRHDASGREATAKYFYLSVLSSTLLLYGFSFLYGTTGSMELAEIRAKMTDPALMGAGFGPLAKMALVLIFAGLGFRITAVPFHFYAPDVYQGTSHHNASLLSVIPKAAGLVALVRVVLVAMPHLQPYAWRLALVLSLVTMTTGNVLALWQDNLRRLLAYSSIAHSGYMLIGLAVGLAGPNEPGSWDGVGAMLFYLGVYILATTGTFSALVYLGREHRAVEGIDELAGLGKTHPLVAVALAVFMFSLAGIPPLAGFWGKLTIFASAVGVDSGAGAIGSARPWFIFLAVAGVLNSVVAAVYYLRVVVAMYFRAPLATLRAEGGAGAWLAAAICGLLVLGLGVQGSPLLRGAMHASPTLRAASATTGEGRFSLGDDANRGSGSIRSTDNLAGGPERPKVAQ